MNKYNFNQFITNENFNSLYWCIIIVVSMTEFLKALINDIDPRIVVLFMSAITSCVRMYLSTNESKKNFIILFLDIFPIYLGSLGSYDSILKIIKNLFNWKEYYAIRSKKQISCNWIQLWWDSSKRNHKKERHSKNLCFPALLRRVYHRNSNTW